MTTGSFNPDMATIRQLATLIPGELPSELNGIDFAASIRPRKFVIEGGDETPVSMPRTVYQLVYPDGTIMLDAGMDQATHDSFGEGEPFYPPEFDKLMVALRAARMIVFTHFHADHVAGVVTADDFEALAGKTLATHETIARMIENPHRPHLKLTQAQGDAFIAFGYSDYFPVAPGLVLIKAPGHSHDMQMAYIRLKSGQEILHSVDAAWNMDNIKEMKGKAAPWLEEDKAQVVDQLRWLNGFIKQSPETAIVVTHDGEQYELLKQQGVLGEFKLD